MSKLSERLRRAQRGSTAAIGFGTTAAAATKVAPLLLLARLSPNDLTGTTTAVASGADALIFGGGLPSAEVRSALAEGPQIPWGLTSGDALPSSIEEVKEASADFVIVSAAKGRASWMDTEEGPGWGLEVSLDWADSLLRAVDSLPLDVVYLAEALTSDQLSVEQALRLRRVAQLAQRPLLVPLEGSWGSADLQALMATGALGVVAEGDAALKELRPLLDQLPARGRRPAVHMEAALPRPPEAIASTPPVEDKGQPLSGDGRPQGGQLALSHCGGWHSSSCDHSLTASIMDGRMPSSIPRKGGKKWLLLPERQPL